MNTNVTDNERNNMNVDEEKSDCSSDFKIPSLTEVDKKEQKMQRRNKKSLK